MDTRKVDVAIIGSGTAGLNARREVEKAGGTPLLIESGPYGTTCARVGCMPSKLLIAAADRAHAIETAGPFGLVVGHWGINGEKVMQRVRRERDRFVAPVVETTEALPRQQRLVGTAKFVGPTTLEVDGQTRIDANAVVIATGASAFVPPPYANVREQILINDDVFELQELPESIAIAGTGIIGLEIGQALQRLGVKVTFFTPHDHLGPVSDPTVRKSIRKLFAAELDLRMNTDVNDARIEDDGIRLTWTEADGSSHDQWFAKVLVAAGRKPNLTELNLAATGLILNDRGLPAWNPETTQCGDAPIFMAGDATNHIPLLHEASDEGRIAGANSMLWPNVVRHKRRTPLGIAFTDPQIAMVGQHHANLDPESIEIGEVSFKNQGRARVNGRNHGVLRVYGDKRNCTLIGAELFAPEAEHLAHLLAWSIEQELTVEKILTMPVYHPVLEEGMRTALRDLAKKLHVAGQCRSNTMAPGD
jgi:dihydrolipoamide dehydrogenase